MFCVADCIRHGIRPTVPQPTERQHIGNQIDATMIFARSDFVKVNGTHSGLSAVSYLCHRVGIGGGFGGNGSGGGFG
jgi:hypothetical protein